VRKRASLKVYGFPKDMPDHIDVDVTSLDFHHAIKVADMKMKGLEFLDPQAAAIAAVEVPRAAKMAAEDAAAATPAAGAEGAAAPAAGAAAPAAGDAKKAEAPKKDAGKK
jgi:large subunit ribosomal protein L25